MGNASFTEAMREVLIVFKDELDRTVTVQELGPQNARLHMLAQPGETSDMLFREFYPKREVDALLNAAEVLREIARQRKSGGVAGAQTIDPDARRTTDKPPVKRGPSSGMMVFDY